MLERKREQFRSYRTAEYRSKCIAKGKGRACAACGEMFYAPKRQPFCSQKCGQSRNRIHADKAARVAAEASRRRARKRTTQIERFTKIEIYERDGWICQICTEPVDPTLKPPAHMSASLDHITPLAAGGAHTRENVQCSHWICNSRKGHR